MGAPVCTRWSPQPSKSYSYDSIDNCRIARSSLNPYRRLLRHQLLPFLAIFCKRLPPTKIVVAFWLLPSSYRALPRKAAPLSEHNSKKKTKKTRRRACQSKRTPGKEQPQKGRSQQALVSEIGVSSTSRALCRNLRPMERSQHSDVTWITTTNTNTRNNQRRGKW